MPNVELCISIPPKLKEMLEVKAQQMGITVEELVIIAITRVLEQ